MLFWQDETLTLGKVCNFNIILNAHSLYYSSERLPPSHSYSTKHSKQNFPVLLFTSSAGQKSTFYQFSSLWSKLPSSFKNTKNFWLFQRQLKNHLLTAQPGALLCGGVLLTLLWGLHTISLATVHDVSIINICATLAVFMYLYMYLFSCFLFLR